MRTEFAELYGILRKDREISPWSGKLTLQERLTELKKEVEEVFEAVEKNDINNLHEELGDVMWDLLAAMVIAEEKYNFDIKKTLQDTINKMKQRKPWIFNNEVITVEEEIQRFAEIKTKLKNNIHGGNEK